MRVLDASAISFLAGAAVALSAVWANKAISESPLPVVTEEARVLRRVDIVIRDCVDEKHPPSWRVSLARYECREVPPGRPERGKR